MGLGLGVDQAGVSEEPSSANRLRQGYWTSHEGRLEAAMKPRNPTSQRTIEIGPHGEESDDRNIRAVRRLDEPRPTERKGPLPDGHAGVEEHVHLPHHSRVKISRRLR